METCNLPPFRFSAVPQPVAEDNSSAAQINEQAIEAYLARLSEAVCNDLTSLEARIVALESPP